MRDILFRGKRKDNGEWVEGNLFIPDKHDTPTQILMGTCFIRIPYDVIPETLGQYTGLTDKNGKKIFEGDIVKGLFLFGKEVLSNVVFKDGAFGLEWVRGNAIEFNAFTSLCNIQFEVIGNISTIPNC